MFKTINWYVAKISWKPDAGKRTSLYLIEIFASSLEEAKHYVEAIVMTQKHLASLMSLEPTWELKSVTANVHIQASWTRKIK